MAQIKYNLGTVSGITVTELWSGASGKTVGRSEGLIVALNDDFTNYKFLVFEFKVSYNSGNSSTYTSKIITPSQIINVINDNKVSIGLDFCWGYNGSGDFYELKAESTTRTLKAISNNSQCIRILGIN